MGIPMIGTQSVQAVVNLYAQNRGSLQACPNGGVKIGQPQGEVVTISDAARKAMHSAAGDGPTSAREYKQLELRGLSDDEITSFRDIRAQADGASNAKAFLSSLSQAQRDLVKRANSYGLELSQPHIASMSEEGARNMLVAQDCRSYVDYDDNGVVETGVAKSFSFPPPNSPAQVKEAWYKTLDALPENERLGASSIFMVQSFQANIKQDGAGHGIGTYAPGEEGYTDIFPTSLDQWSTLLDKTDAYLDWQESVDPGNPSIARNRTLLALFRSNLMFA